jgi:hypothetical protein
VRGIEICRSPDRREPTPSYGLVEEFDSWWPVPLYSVSQFRVHRLFF